MRLILISFLLCLIATPANAAEGGKTYWVRTAITHSNLGSCDNAFTNVDSLYWVIKPDAFNGGVIDSTRDEIEENISADLTKLLTENTGTPDSKTSIAIVKTADDPDKILSAHPKALYLKIQIIGVCEDGVGGSHSCGTEMEFFTKKNRGSEINIGSVDFDAKTGAKVPVDGGKESLSYNLQKFLIAISCSILKNNSKRECTLPLDPEKNEVVPQKTACQMEKE